MNEEPAWCIVSLMFALAASQRSAPGPLIRQRAPTEGGVLCNEEIIEPPELYPKLCINAQAYTVADGHPTEAQTQSWAGRSHALNLITLQLQLFFYGRQYCRHNKERQRSLINLESSVDLGRVSGGFGPSSNSARMNTITI